MWKKYVVALYISNICERCFFSVSARCDVMHLPEAMAPLFACKRGFALIATKWNKHMLTLTSKNKGKRPGKFTLIEAKTSILKK